MPSFNQQLKRNPYGYAPKPGRNGKLQSLRNLTSIDRQHIKQWRAMGFSITAIAKEYDLTYAYVANLIRGIKRK